MDDDHGMRRFWKLGEEQILSLFLYGMAPDGTVLERVALAGVVEERLRRSPDFGENYHEIILRPKEFYCMGTCSPIFPSLFDIAGCFIRALETNKELFRCFEVAKGIVSGIIISGIHLPFCSLHKITESGYKGLTVVERFYFYDKE